MLVPRSSTVPSRRSPKARGDERLLGLHRRRIVCVRLGVRRPGVTAWRFESFDDLAKLSHLSAKRLERILHACAGFAHVLRTTRKAAFELSLHRDVEQNAGLQAVAPAEHAAHFCYGDLAEPGKELRARIDPFVRHQEQREQKGAAELGVPGPERALLPALDGVHVDEARHGTLEEHVEGRRVLQDEALVEARLERTKRGKRRVPHHREAPLVHVAYERQFRLAHDPFADDPRIESLALAREECRGNEQAAALERLEQPTGAGVAIRGQRSGGAGPVDGPAVTEQPPRGVPEGRRVKPDHSAGRIRSRQSRRELAACCRRRSA